MLCDQASNSTPGVSGQSEIAPPMVRPNPNDEDWHAISTEHLVDGHHDAEEE